MTKISVERIAAIEARKEELQTAMAAGDLDPQSFVKLSKDYAEIEPVAAAAREVRRLRDEAASLAEMTHEADEARSEAGHPGPRRLLSLIGIAVATVAVLVHIVGGAALVHGGLVAPLAALGPGALVLGLAALIAVKLAVVLTARRWVRHRR